MSPAMVQLIVLGVQQGLPLMLQLAALARVEGGLSDEQKAAIDAAAHDADVTWDERVAEARARVEAAAVTLAPADPPADPEP